MRKVTIDVRVKLLVHIDDDAVPSEVMDEMEYSFTDTTGKATVVDESMEDYDFTDSR